MHESTERSELVSGRFGRGIATLALTTALFAGACTTNQNRGTGEPGTSGPAVGPVAPAATPGSSGAAMPQKRTSSPEESASIMREHQAYAGKYLGPADPGNGAARGASAMIPTGQLVNPSSIPQRTVNSSISSRPTAAVVSGAGDASAGAVAGAVLAPTSVGGTNTALSNGPIAVPGGIAATVPAGTTSSAIAGSTSVMSPASPVANVTAARSVSATPLSNATSSQQSASAIAPVLRGGFGATNVSATGTAGATAARSLNGSGTTVANTSSSGTGSRAQKAVRITQNSDGSVTLTNAGSNQ